MHHKQNQVLLMQKGHLIFWFWKEVKYAKITGNKFINDNIKQKIFNVEILSETKF